MTIPIFVPNLPSTEELLPFLREIEISKTYSNFGPVVTSLHSKLAEYFAVEPDQVITLANATLALEGAIQTSSNSETEWSTPSWTFAATNLAIERCNIRYQFQDVDQEWRLNNTNLKSSILDVCPFGDTLDLARFHTTHKTILVDAAASFTALKGCGIELSMNSGPVGVVVSFHPTKILPGAEGGVFISNSSQWVEEVKSWSRFGMKSGSRISEQIGTNAKMNEYQAAVILASMKKFQTLEERWCTIHRQAKQASKDLKLGVHPAMKKGFLSTYWIIESSPSFIDLIEASSNDKTFQSRRWWEHGCHKMPAFSRVPATKLTNSERIAASTIGLPFHTFMRDNDFEIIYEFLLRLKSQYSSFF